MADLNELQATGITKLIGADASANEQTPVQSTANGGLHVNLRNNAGTELATTGNPAIVAGPGVAGTPAGGVLSVQGVAGGTAMPSSQSGTWTTGRTWTLASGTDSVSAVQSGTWNITNISGTVSLPTGAATAANQATEITSLQLLDNIIGSVAAGTAGTNSALIGGVFNTALPTLTNGQQSAIQFDSSGRVIIAPLTNTSVVKAQLQDNAGNALASTNSQLQTRDIINAVPLNAAISVTTTQIEAKVGGSALANRKVLVITPTNGTVYWGATGVTTANGTPIFKNQSLTLSFSNNAPIFLIAATGSVNVRIVEGA